MSSDGTDQQQASSLAKHGDDASSNLGVAVVNAHPDTNTLTDSRIDKLLNILQGNTAKESWDATLMKQIEDGDLKGWWELSIEPSDWDSLIKRGLTWTQLRHFIRDTYSNLIVMGPLCLTTWFVSDIHNLDCQVTMNGLTLYRLKHRQTDADMKTTLDGLQKLLRASGEIYVPVVVHSNSVVKTGIVENDEGLHFRNVEHLDVEMWTTYLHNPHLVELRLDECSFADKGAFICGWLTNRKHPIEMLTLEYSTIPAALLASALRSTTCVKKLRIRNMAYSEAGWELLINGISEMQNLKSVNLPGFFGDNSNWVNHVSTLMANTHLQNVYFTYPYERPPRILDSNTKKQNTERIHALLKMNPHVLDLRMPWYWFDKDMWKSQVKPIIFERQAVQLACELEGLTASDASSLIGSILCQYQYYILDADAVFQVLLHNSDTIKVLWDLCREKRMMALDSLICKWHGHSIGKVGMVLWPDGRADATYFI